MALTVDQLIEQSNYDFQHGNPENQNAYLTRVLSGMTSFIEARTVDTIPEDVKDLAIIRMAAYFFDMPAAGRNENYAHIWRSSGAASLCGPWMARRTGITEAA